MLLKETKVTVRTGRPQGAPLHRSIPWGDPTPCRSR